MATIVLQAVGAAIGTAIAGPIGGMVGRSLGALGGAYIDQQIFGPGDQVSSGPRMESTQILTSREGSAIPRAYGRTRLAGEIIWATRLLEVQSTETQSQGGKGGGGSETNHVSYAYFGNFAIGLCEGEIAHVGRIWADGKLLDQTQHTIRCYTGGEAQQPDSLIELKQGAGNAPAYRGLAYLVFESFPLENYGNRIPQIFAEVIRPVGDMLEKIYAVNLIPGATEFGYDTQPVIEAVSEVENKRLNSHQLVAETDLLASLDELTHLCPNLTQIALVTAWFGDDLRAGECQIRPRVEVHNRNIESGQDWQVGELSRSAAQLVSYDDGNPAYGGTPSDGSVVRAIQEIKSRGVKVCFNPFVMMDIPDGNGLPDPYGQAQQASYPWRGRITCHPAPQMPGTPDRSVTARQQAEEFVGSAQPHHFSRTSDSVIFSGPPQWSYRRMILHYAHLSVLAGGVDMFLIGSEMRGLTSLRGSGDSFPFVEALQALAADVASIVGPSCQISYGADWSEYFGYQPDDGSNNVYFNLDPLWAEDSIDAVGIDNYMPISDWRSTGDPEGIGRTGSDPAMLAAHIASGEGYEWFYATAADREYGIRTAITDGLGKPWVYRYKDLKSWWQNDHYERRAGVEQPGRTPWRPQSKPIIFTELGCPAVNNGAAQPNVFVDPKSAESALPYFSNGGRNDQLQLAYIAAHQNHWLGGGEDPNNPVSEVYGGPMVDFHRAQFWAWDARPYPAFPSEVNVWSDYPNWQNGHWLNGRLGMVLLADLIAELLTSSGVTEFDVSQVTGIADGYLIGDGSSARQALDVLIELHRLAVFEDAGIVFFRSPGFDPVTVLALEQIVHAGNDPATSFVREQETEVPIAVQLTHFDPHFDFQETHTRAARINASGVRQKTIHTPMVLGRDGALPLLEAWLHARWTARDSVTFGLSRQHEHLTVGDVIAFSDAEFADTWRITRIDSGDQLSIAAIATELGEHLSPALLTEFARTPASHGFARPLSRFMDLPYLPTLPDNGGNCLAVVAAPWPGELAVYASPSNEGYSYQQSIDSAAFIGELEIGLDPSTVTGRWDYQSGLRLKLHHGSLSSLSSELVLNGANGLAVQSASGAFEIIQFQTAELVAEQTYQLSNLLRGQAGTEVEAAQGAATGAPVIVLNQAVTRLLGDDKFRGLETNWLVGPVGKQLDGVEFSQSVFTPGYRSLQPYSPVHLRAVILQTGDVEISWIRRDRINADDWAAVEIPMSEAAEAYDVTVTSPLPGQVAESVSRPSLSVSSETLIAAFGALPAELTIAVSQISNTVGPGPAAILNISL